MDRTPRNDWNPRRWLAAGKSVGGAVACAAALAGCASTDADTKGKTPIDVTPVWSTQIGGEGLQFPNAVAATSNSVVLGAAYTEAFSVADQQLSNAGGLDGVVLALDEAGAVRWMRQLAGAGDDRVSGVATTTDGNVFMVGQASTGASFGGHDLAVDALGAAVLAKLTPEGDVAWTVSGRGSGFHAATSVAVASDGDVYFAGDYSNDLDLGLGVMESTGGDSFVARVSAAGDVQWVKTFGGAGPQHIAEIAVGPDDEVTLIGGYAEQLGIDNDVWLHNPLSNTTPFVAHLRSDGSLAWVQTSLLPASINHIGQTHEDSHPGHSAVAVEDLNLSVAPSGSVTASVSYGKGIADDGRVLDFTVLNNVTLTTLAASGKVEASGTLTAPAASFSLGQLLNAGARTELALSWTGELSSSTDSEAFDSKLFTSSDHRSLAVLSFTADGRFVPKTVFSVSDVGLTSQDAVRAADGSTVVAMGWRDLHTLDDDIFLARFAK